MKRKAWTRKDRIRYYRKYREKNKKKMSERHKKWMEENSNHIKEYNHKKYLERKQDPKWVAEHNKQNHSYYERTKKRDKRKTK